MNILLTGSSGFLSQYLVFQLAPICNLIDTYNYRNPESSHLSCDATYDFLVDIGSPTPLNSDDNPTTYTTHLKQVKALYDQFSICNTIFISSVSVFGDSCGFISESSQYRPNSCYSNHKIMVEQAHLKSSQNTLTLISSGLCGPGMSRIFLTRLLQNFINTGQASVAYTNELFNGIYPASYLSSYIVDQILAGGFLSRKELIHSSDPLSWCQIRNLFEQYIGQPLTLLGSTSKPESKIFCSANFAPLLSVRQTLELTFRDLYPDVTT